MRDFEECKTAALSGDAVCPDKRFETLLKDAVAGTITPEAEDELAEEFFFAENPEEAFTYLKTAADRGYTEAYYWLARAYLNGDGCTKSIDQALHYFQLSVATGHQGCLELADCYRLGMGVERNYETAWEYYSRLFFADECTIDDFRLPDVILRNSECHIDELKESGIPAEWWEFAMTHVDGSPSLFGKMASLYEEKSERWLYWAKKAADGGDVLFMMKMLDVIPNEDDKQKTIAAILASDFTLENDWIIEETARKILAGEYPGELKEKAALVLFHNDRTTTKDMKDKSFTDLLEVALRNEELDSDEEGEYDPDFFVCSCCHRRFPVDEIDDPDMHGTICNDCYYTGKCIEPDVEDDTDQQ